MTDKIVAFSTAPSQEEAARIARHLVDRRAAACVTVVPGVTSVYRWQGAVEENSEWLLIIKTRRECLDRLRQELATVHSYQVPELVALAIVDGLPDYLDWLDRETAG